MKHTPGPWTLDEDSYTVLGDGRNVARVYTVDDFTCDGDDAEIAKECAANAALIAAAPDLYAALDRALAALKDVYEEWGRETGRKQAVIEWLINDDPAVVAGLAALRKARGAG